MKKLIIIFTLAALTLSVIAQAPQRLSYQAVIRNSTGGLVASHAVGMKISILQGSPTGTTVYVETHTTTTNANGLATIEIGGRTVTSGSFSGINWGSGIYFIKTETDVAGGSSYSITGTSQILSVPYALYAKTAANGFSGAWADLSGVPVVFNPAAHNHAAVDISSGTLAVSRGGTGIASYTTGNYIYAAGSASLAQRTPAQVRSDIGAGTGNGTVTSIATNNGITGGTITNTGTLGLSGQALALHNLGTSGLITRTGAGTVTSRTITEGTGINVTNGNGVSGNPRISAETYSIGEFAQGGIVFWVDATGQHGLVCAKSDQSSGIRWYAGTYCKTQALGDGPMAGEMNTAIIIASQAAIGDDGATYAARMCNELKITSGKTYGDWYLPSTEELDLMYQNKDVINATAARNGGDSFSTGHYWSSTEYGPNGKNYAWSYNLFSGGDVGAEKSIDYFRVRAVRAF